MKCPLLKESLKVDGKIFPLVPAECLRAECAWWSSDHGKCAVLLMSDELHWLDKNLVNIANLMSRGG